MEEKRRVGHSLLEKRYAIELYNSGLNVIQIGHRLDIDRTLIRLWLKIYDIYGITGLEQYPISHPISASIKEQVVREVLEKCVSCADVAAIYKVSKRSVHRWVNIVKENGYESLNVRSKDKQLYNMGRPRKKEPQSKVDKMEEELRLLRTENAYLKKLRALVEERIARESGKSSKPSKN